MAKHDDILDRPILSLSEKDDLRLRDLVEGTLITGAPGSGKSSTSGKQLAYGLLRIPGSGGLVLTAKAEETQNWIAYARDCGRGGDLIVFNAESGDCFDPLHYEWTRPGRGAGDLESIIDFFSTLVSIGKKEVGHGHDPFGSAAMNSSCATLSSCSISRASASLLPTLTASLSPFRPIPANTRKNPGRRSRTALNLLPPLRSAGKRSLPTNGAISTLPRNTFSRNGRPSTNGRDRRWR